MGLELSFAEAAWFLPFVAPICLYVIYSDLSTMKITNIANLALVGVFLVIGLLVLPLPEYGWRLMQLAIMLALGFLFNIIGLMGAGDSKFLAAAAPFIVPGDAVRVVLLLSVLMVVSIAVHRMARNSRLKDLAPHWASWSNKEKFPMGLALGATLIAYLLMGLLLGG